MPFKVKKKLTFFERVANWDNYLFFHRKRLEPRLLPWQHHRYHPVSYVMYISGAKFKEHCFNISGYILDSVFYC